MSKCEKVRKNKEKKRVFYIIHDYWVPVHHKLIIKVQETIIALTASLVKVQSSAW